jgi:hypothetical protein
MSRLIATTLLLLVVLVSFDYSLANAPRAETSSTTVLTPDSSPVEALTEATDAAVEATPVLDVVTWDTGVYAVTDAQQVRTFSSDHDVESEIEVISDDVTFEASSIPASAQQLAGDLEPGLYATSFEAEDCTYELWQVLNDGQPSVIAEEYLASGRLLVSINEIEPDWFSSTPGCGDWRQWEPLIQPLARADNGDYWVGDLARGRWSVPPGCLWEKVVAFRGAELADVEESGGPGSSLVVDGDTFGVRVRNCRAPLILVDPSADRGKVSGPR